MSHKTQNTAEPIINFLNNDSVACCGKDDTISEVLTKMEQLGVWALAVTNDQNQIYGMVTDREIGRRIFKQTVLTSAQIADIQDDKALSALTAGDVMIANPHCLNVQDDIDTALETMTHYGYRYMPVIDSEKKIMGIMNLRELLQIAYKRHKLVISQQKNMLASFMHHEPYGGAGGFNGWEAAS